MYPNKQIHKHNHQDNMLCVNCGIRLNRIKRIWVSEESEELRQLLTDWVCKELEDNEVLCGPCCSLLHSALENENKSRRFGHKNVCLSCGISLNRTRNIKNLDAYPEQKFVIVQWIPSHQIKRLKVICLNCFTKARRLLEKTNNGLHSKVQCRRTKDKSNDTEVKIERLGYDELDIPASPDSQKSSDEEEIPEKYPQHLSISLNGYKRAADTSSRCIFKNCGYSDRSLVHKSIRERLLVDYSFYVPTHSRICKHHQTSSHETWRKMIDSATITDFTSAHIENLFSIIKNIKCSFYCKSFESQLKKDDYLCQYFLGMSYEKLEEMRKDIKPIRKRVWGVKKTLAMYLMKKHTGFSSEKVANFFGVRSRLLEKVIKSVHAYLETIIATDDSYVAVPTIGVDKQEEIVYYRV